RVRFRRRTRQSAAASIRLETRQWGGRPYPPIVIVDRHERDYTPMGALAGGPLAFAGSATGPWVPVACKRFDGVTHGSSAWQGGGPQGDRRGEAAAGLRSAHSSANVRAGSLLELVLCAARAKSRAKTACY